MKKQIIWRHVIIFKHEVIILRNHCQVKIWIEVNWTTERTGSHVNCGEAERTEDVSRSQ